MFGPRVAPYPWNDPQDRGACSSHASGLLFVGRCEALGPECLLGGLAAFGCERKGPGSQQGSEGTNLECERSPGRSQDEAISLGGRKAEGKGGNLLGWLSFSKPRPVSSPSVLTPAGCGQPGPRPGIPGWRLSGQGSGRSRGRRWCPRGSAPRPGVLSVPCGGRRE